ncbi:hypothetical protein [Paenibacillus sp. QZ-Y1]|uniref:hypothetical protein n=1 Tax=Paenibacillus sp. QZ-Y1 TaxID=3414511 RepID=UPI003F79E8BB
MNTREEQLQVIKDRVDQLYKKIETEDEMIIDYLADSGELFFSGITIFKIIPSGYEVLIDKYDLNGFNENGIAIWRTDTIEEPADIHESIANNLNLQMMWEDIDGTVTL